MEFSNCARLLAHIENNSHLSCTASGQFVIEYVGEVVNYKEFKRRFEDYNSRGNKHFYFMSLSGDQVCAVACTPSMLCQTAVVFAWDVNVKTVGLM